jgi:hypothetical protein
MQQRELGVLSTPEKRGGARSWSPHKLSVNKWLERQKGRQWADDKSMPEIGHIAVHKAHLFSQWATPKVKQCCKIEKQQTSITRWQQRAGWWISDLAPEKGHKAKKQAPNKPTQWKPNSKAGRLVGHRADLQNLRTSHTFLRELLTK